MTAATNTDMKNLKFLKFLLIKIYQTNYAILKTHRQISKKLSFKQANVQALQALQAEIFRKPDN